jgi:hypothetical protein
MEVQNPKFLKFKMSFINLSVDLQKLVLMETEPAYFASACFALFHSEKEEDVNLRDQICNDYFLKMYKQKWVEKDDEFDPVLWFSKSNEGETFYENANNVKMWEYLYFFNLIFSFDQDEFLHNCTNNDDLLDIIVKYAKLNTQQSKENMAHIAEMIMDGSEYGRIQYLKIFVKYLEKEDLEYLHTFGDYNDDKEDKEYYKLVDVIKEEIKKRE